MTITETPTRTMRDSSVESPPSPPRPSGLRRWQWRAPSGSQLIVGVIGLLAAVLYTWGLSRNGTANSYYTAAVRSGAKSWKAFFFGALDPGSFITVDKPPAALWVMELSARIFGFSSWSMLLPEAAAGVGSVLILHRLVRKWVGELPAHLSALALAVTPVAVLMFRFNNPDAFLTLVCLGAAWAMWSALETGRTRSLLLAGALVGLGFETKMLQAFLVVPAMALVYLWAGPPRLRRRIGQLAAAAVAMLVASGWWIAVVALWPASSRPYIGSTTNNSILSLVFGYNGLARILGNTSGTPGGGGAGSGAGFGGAAGVLRLFNGVIGGQVAWLIPLACSGLLAGLWLTRHGRRTDLGRAGWVLWGGWALVCAAVFSLSKGIFHPYYTVQLAPAVAALAGAGGVVLWQLGRQHRWLGWVLPTVVVGTAGLAVEILLRTPRYDPWLRNAIMVGAGLACAGLLASTYLRLKVTMAVAGVIAAATLLAGPAAYAFTTVTHSTTGPIVSAGPATTSQARGAITGAVRPAGAPAGVLPGGVLPGGVLPAGVLPAGVLPPAGAAGGFPIVNGARQPGGVSTVSSGLIAYLEANRHGAEYLVAAFGSQSSAPIIIATGQPVITIGGFNGADPAPTLAQFEKLVGQGKVRFVLVETGGMGGIGGAPGGSGSSISSWVSAHGTLVAASSYGGSTGAGALYQLSAT